MTDKITERRRPLSLLRDLLESESAGGLVLMVVTLLAILTANSSLAARYFALRDLPLFGHTVLDWINDALMALFFLMVGLEIKREMVEGQLSAWSRRALPGIAALGGMLVPALIYVGSTWPQSEMLRGWAISSATDIAFALGVISLLGSRVPVSLKVFLAALAILDDLGAVLIIAVFYTSELSGLMLAFAAATLGLLIAFNRLKVTALLPYLLLGALLWVFVFKSGLHATLAGVALALTIPIRRSPGHVDDPTSPLHRLAHALSKPVAFGIIPLFGFANAGVSFAGVGADAMLHPVPLGIGLGLFLGKQIGVFGFSVAAILSGLADKPAKATWVQLYGVSILCGIGFTMSLFIALLAFPESEALQSQTKIGVLAGSILSGLVGLALLAVACPAVAVTRRDA